MVKLISTGENWRIYLTYIGVEFLILPDSVDEYQKSKDEAQPHNEWSKMIIGFNLS